MSEFKKEWFDKIHSVNVGEYTQYKLVDVTARVAVLKLFVPEGCRIGMLSSADVNGGKTIRILEIRSYPWLPGERGEPIGTELDVSTFAKQDRISELEVEVDSAIERFILATYPQYLN